MGTAEAILRVTAGPCLDDAVRRRGFSTGAHVAAGRWYVLGGAAASGALVEWYLDLIAASASPTERYELPARARCADAGVPTGLVVRPTPRGRAAPLPDPEARASIEGLDLETDAARVGRAVLEGVAFHARWMLDELAALTSAPIDHVRLIGGGVADAPLVAIKAALGPGTIRAVQEPEAVIVGAALVAGLASGIHGSVDEAVAIAPPAVPVEHRLDASAYQQAYERWRPR
jgi:sugar (pentulose or hexulose) kinase